MENLPPQNQETPSSPRLGFREIVPGHDGGMPQEQDPEISIPEFDVSRQLMVDERRESASRRQGPGQKRDAASEAEPIECLEPVPDDEVPDVVSSPASVRISAYRHPVIQRHAIVEDIVRRDIQRLCMGQKTA